VNPPADSAPPAAPAPPAPKQMEIINHTGLPLNWITGIVHFPRRSAAFIVKATYDLVPDGVARRAGEQQGHTGDLPWPPLPDVVGEPGLRYASDFALFKPCADVLLAGSAHAPGDQPLPVLSVTLGVGAWRKHIAVIGDRRWTGWRTTDPLPFASMPLRWELAFGGPGFAENPVGRGNQGDLLPNLERSGDLVTSRRSRPIPACFCPLAPTWDERKRKAGTYRRDYLATRWPAFAEDFDWGWFNAAPLDQQVPGYLQGDEPILLEHLHPRHARVESRLPGMRPRLFVARHDGVAAEVTLVCDTLWIDADALAAVVVWRGLAPVVDEALSDVAAIYLLEEPLARTAPAAEHIAEFARLRAAAAEPPVAHDDGADRAAFTEELARPADAPPVSATWTVATVAARLAAGGALAGEDLRGLDLTGSVGPGAVLSGALLTGTILRGALLSGVDLSACDLSGADLSEADLTGADLHGADLTGARLEKTLLTKARLTGAILVDAHLAGAILTGADLAQADCARADFTEADLGGAVLDDAILGAARLDRARLRGASLKAATLAGASAIGADFEAADLTKIKASPDADFSGARLRRIRGGDGSWSRCRFTGADLSFARLDAAQFAQCAMAGAILLGASLKRALFDGADLSAAVLDHANLAGASLARCKLVRTSFRSANCFSAGFTDAERHGADFTDANTMRSDLAAGSKRT
jgi:uncharacterized protein YjbI with pentapeptide repeats